MHAEDRQLRSRFLRRESTTRGPRRDERAGRGRGPNLIIDWLTRRAERCDAYLHDLALIDRTLRERLGQAYGAARRTDRLALALFVDFARGQTLSAGELAMLMADARADAVDAVRFLIDEAARTPAAAPRGADARVTDDPSRNPGRRAR